MYLALDYVPTVNIGGSRLEASRSSWVSTLKATRYIKPS